MAVDLKYRTFELAHEVLMRRFDAAVADLRKVHADLDFFNNEGRLYQAIKDRFGDIECSLWQLKSVYAEQQERTEPWPG